MLHFILISLLISSLHPFFLTGCGDDKRCLTCLLGSCIYCQESYISISTEVCTEPSQKVNNCLTYKSNGVCGECTFGNRIARNGSECVKIQ